MLFLCFPGLKRKEKVKKNRCIFSRFIVKIVAALMKTVYHLGVVEKKLMITWLILQRQQVEKGISNETAMMYGKLTPLQNRSTSRFVAGIPRCQWALRVRAVSYEWCLNGEQSGITRQSLIQVLFQFQQLFKEIKEILIDSADKQRQKCVAYFCAWKSGALTFAHFFFCFSNLL